MKPSGVQNIPLEIISMLQKRASEELWVEAIVVDTCFYGRTGLTSLLYERGIPVIGRESLSVDAFWRAECSCCVIIRIPTCPTAGLALMLSLGDVHWGLAWCNTLIVLSPFQREVMRHVISCLHLPCKVYVVDARLPQVNLCCSILDLRKENHVLLPIMNSLPSSWLSAHERHAICYSLQGIPVYFQARRRAVSVKTVYSQRACALKKLGVNSMSALIGMFG
jgi:hypothetical protein